MKKRIVIAGTSGFAAEVTQYIEDNIKAGQSELDIKGYLDIDFNNREKYGYKAPLLGNEKEYQLENGDVFVVAIGILPLRNEIIETLQTKGAEFLNFIHHSAQVSSRAKIGNGNIICPHTVIGPNSKIGNFNILNYFSAIAHDAEVGDGNVFAPYNNVTGWAQIGNHNVFGSGVHVLPKMKVGSDARIQAGTIVSKNVNERTFYFSNIRNQAIPL